MDIDFFEVTESDYSKLDRPILFEDVTADRAFAVISDGENQYKFGWQSPLVKPKLVPVSGPFWSIGIDLTFVVVDFDKGLVCLRLDLNSFFHDAKVSGGAVYVATTMEIIQIDIDSLVVVKTYDLPDSFETFEIDEMSLAVKCVNGEVFELE